MKVMMPKTDLDNLFALIQQGKFDLPLNQIMGVLQQAQANVENVEDKSAEVADAPKPKRNKPKASQKSIPLRDVPEERPPTTPIENSGVEEEVTPKIGDAPW